MRSTSFPVDPRLVKKAGGGGEKVSSTTAVSAPIRTSSEASKVAPTRPASMARMIDDLPELFRPTKRLIGPRSSGPGASNASKVGDLDSLNRHRHRFAQGDALEWEVVTQERAQASGGQEIR